MGRIYKTGALGPRREVRCFVYHTLFAFQPFNDLRHSPAEIVGGQGYLLSTCSCPRPPCDPPPPRLQVPTAMEIDSCKARLPVLVRVYHLDGELSMYLLHSVAVVAF